VVSKPPYDSDTRAVLTAKFFNYLQLVNLPTVGCVTSKSPKAGNLNLLARAGDRAPGGVPFPESSTECCKSYMP
jgi:hypothetical protein